MKKRKQYGAAKKWHVFDKDGRHILTVWTPRKMSEHDILNEMQYCDDDWYPFFVRAPAKITIKHITPLMEKKLKAEYQKKWQQKRKALTFPPA